MPKIEILKNGLRFMTEPMAHMESVAIGIWIRAGGRYEERKNSGISHLLEHLLFKGTKKRDMMKIKQEIEGRGGSFNGFTSEDHTCYLVKLLSQDAGLGVDILSDMVLDPRLDQAEIDKEKCVIIEEINMYRDMPAQHVHEILAELMWPEQPLGMPLAGTVESVKSITREELVRYKEAHHNPANMLMTGAGKIKAPDMEALCEKYLSAPGPGEAARFEAVRIDQERPVVRVISKDTEQTHIALGIHSFDRFHPDRYALSLLNIILGGNMSSRLFHIVRDEMALCYEISASVRRYEDCGSLVVNAGVEEKKLVKALEVILSQIARMRTEAVSGDELDRAREYYRGQLLFALEDTASRMLWIGDRMICGETELDAKTILARVDKVTAGDITRVAQAMFRDDRLNLAVIGPVKDEKAVREGFHL